MKFNSIIIYIVVSLLFNAISAIAGGNPSSNFSTPEKTIETYYEYFFDRDILSECFYPEGYSGSLDKFWSNYQIIGKKMTTKTGKTTHSGVVVLKGAVEIIVEVAMKSTKKKNTKTKFWYLLQKINGEWKIIDHSHISDALYPAYD